MGRRGGGGTSTQDRVLVESPWTRDRPCPRPRLGCGFHPPTGEGHRRRQGSDLGPVPRDSLRTSLPSPSGRYVRTVPFGDGTQGLCLSQDSSQSGVRRVTGDVKGTPSGPKSFTQRTFESTSIMGTLLRVSTLGCLATPPDTTGGQHWSPLVSTRTFRRRLLSPCLRRGVFGLWTLRPTSR